MKRSLTHTESGGTINYATYGRYSSNMQRPASLIDQRRNCEGLGIEKGWLPLSNHIYEDAAISGTSTVGREALNRMLAEVRKPNCPFQVIIIDDTSRLSRNLGDQLKITDVLKHHGIRVYFVSQKLDSNEWNFRVMLTVYGMADEQQIARLRTKVHAGQKGRVLGGYSSGSRCFGYRSVRLANPDMPDDPGRAGTIGVRWAVIEVEAEVIRRIFDLFGDGYSMFQIACVFNQEGIRGPRKPRIGNVATAWNATLIKNILKREKYRGVIVWNQTTQGKDPETGQVIIRHKDESEHVRVQAPHLRIVTDEQWNRAAGRRKALDERNAAQVLGGLNRAKKKFYLFSGLLFCGVCREKMRIAGGKDLESSYECPSHRYGRGCTNATRIREDRLCEQLIEALATNLLLPENLSPLIEAVWTEFNQFIDRQRREGPGNDLQAFVLTKGKLQVERERLVHFIKSMDHPPTSIAGDLAHTDAELARIAEQIRTAIVPEKLKFSKADFKNLVLNAIDNLQDVLRSDVIRARLLLQHHVKRLVLFPSTTEDGGRVFEVIGEMDLFSAPQGTTERVLLDYGITAMIQQHTDCLFRFAGLRLHPRLDIYDHPLVDILYRLLRSAPSLTDEALSAREWARLIREATPPDSHFYDRTSEKQLIQALHLNREQFEKRLGVQKNVNRHSGAVCWKFTLRDTEPPLLITAAATARAEQRF